MDRVVHARRGHTSPIDLGGVEVGEACCRIVCSIEESGLGQSSDEEEVANLTVEECDWVASESMSALIWLLNAGQSTRSGSAKLRAC